VTFFDNATGLLHQKSVQAPDDHTIALNTPEGHTAIDHPREGPLLDCFSQRVDVATGNIVDYRPPAPSAEHEWHAPSRRWHLSAPAQARNRERATAVRQIAALEARGQRAIREVFLGYDGASARVKDIDDQIIALRKQL
jgi:hypothetical protein